VAISWQMKVSEKLDEKVCSIACEQGITKNELIKSVIAKYASENVVKNAKSSKEEKYET